MPDGPFGRCGNCNLPYLHGLTSQFVHQATKHFKMQYRNLKYRSLKIPLDTIFGSLGPGLRKTISVNVQTFFRRS